ncbi:MAG: hypothetical protein AAGC55_30205, partial [Myxococcota bacterium]
MRTRSAPNSWLSTRSTRQLAHGLYPVVALLLLCPGGCTTSDTAVVPTAPATDPERAPAAPTQAADAVADRAPEPGVDAASEQRGVMLSTYPRPADESLRREKLARFIAIVFFSQTWSVKDDELAEILTKPFVVSGLPSCPQPIVSNQRAASCLVRSDALRFPAIRYRGEAKSIPLTRVPP